MKQMPRKKTSTKSSSSEPMEASKTQTELLALGRIIVEELGLETSVDTLGRWMAHHVAELVKAAETAPSDDVRRQREREAAEAISQLWVHRSHYENRINPLFDLRPMLDVISKLDTQNPWIERSDACAQAFDVFQELVISLILRRFGSFDGVSRVASNAQKSSAFQSEEERTLIATLDKWTARTKERAQKRFVRRSSNFAADNVDLEKTIEETVAEAHRALDAISAELSKSAGSTRKRNKAVRRRKSAVSSQV